MSSGELGKVYADGELIVHEGEVGDCMYVIGCVAVNIVDAGAYALFEIFEGS